jgi:hypothetical protein
VITPISSESEKRPTARYARARVDLVARDPSLPKQVAILDPVPACTATQLRVDSLSPVVSTPLKVLRAYNATNISAQPCSLAGVPRMRGLDEKGNYQPFLPLACPNCENEFFMPRSNGRIDLNQGETAHLLVASTGRGTDYCISTPKLELSFDREATSIEPSPSTGPLPKDIAQSAAVPFDGHVCTSVDISAWRQDPFDGDPKNFQWAKLHDVLFQTHDSSVPGDCNKPDLLVRGYPSMIPSESALKWGISLSSRTFVRGQPIPLHLWLDNSSDEPASVWTCQDLDYFKARGFDLYDAYGHRVLRKAEASLQEKCAAKDPATVHIRTGWMCTRNFPIQIPSHSCVNGDSYDFTAELQQSYDLPPGEYTVHVRTGVKEESANPCDMHASAPFTATPGADLTFDVVQP